MNKVKIKTNKEKNNTENIIENNKGNIEDKFINNINLDSKLILTSPIPPSVNHYLKPRGFVIYKNNKPIAQVSMYETTEAKKYKKEFSEYTKKEVIKQNWDINQTIHRHHFMDCNFYFERIDQDEQNYYKCLCDSINKIAYIDDQKILTRTNKVLYDSNNPRIEIELHPVSYIGIFEDNDNLSEFLEVCKNCKRYKNNCSILNKALEGRIQVEIVDMVCSNFKQIKK
jgi:crossover junction endodeoxyribonuclease RusA